MCTSKLFITNYFSFISENVLLTNVNFVKESINLRPEGVPSVLPYNVINVMKYVSPRSSLSHGSFSACVAAQHKYISGSLVLVKPSTAFEGCQLLYVELASIAFLVEMTESKCNIERIHKDFFHLKCLEDEIKGDQ